MLYLLLLNSVNHTRRLYFQYAATSAQANEIIGKVYYLHGVPFSLHSTYAREEIQVCATDHSSRYSVDIVDSTHGRYLTSWLENRRSCSAMYWASHSPQPQMTQIYYQLIFMKINRKLFFVFYIFWLFIWLYVSIYRYLHFGYFISSIFAFMRHKSAP